MFLDSLVPLSSIADSVTSTTSTTSKPLNEGPKLRKIPCNSPLDCENVDGSYCDADLQVCLCKPDYPVTDTHQCYKGTGLPISNGYNSEIKPF